MVEEFLQRKKMAGYVGGEIGRCSGAPGRRAMELSLSTSPPFADREGSLSPTELEMKLSKKRKSSWNEPPCQAPIELQLKDPLPLDWEQCLDLQSGRMYYLNRKTLKRSFSWPKSQTLDLELNISPPQDSEGFAGANLLSDPRKERYMSNSMVAVACLRCHLLVMLSRASPSCPNCKYVHPLQPSDQQPNKEDSPRPMETLTLLH